MEAELEWKDATPNLNYSPLRSTWFPSVYPSPPRSVMGLQLLLYYPIPNLVHTKVSVLTGKPWTLERDCLAHVMWVIAYFENRTPPFKIKATLFIHRHKK